MGWFDEDDDDESEASCDHSKTDRRTRIYGRKDQCSEEDEVDPLDAFMSGIEVVAATDARMSKDAAKAEEAAALGANRNSICGDKGVSGGGRLDYSVQNGTTVGRLDVENEEEATAHWNDSSIPSAHASSTTASNSESGGYDYDDVVNGKVKKQIEPLPRFDHDSIEYEPFRRRFHVKNDTNKTNEANWDRWRETNGVTCSADQNPVSSFSEIASVCVAGTFPKSLLGRLSKAGFVTPTPVQCQAIPVILSGENVLGTASTGSGKTLAFSLPLAIHCCDQRHIDPGIDGPIGLVLSPTRELAAQTHRTLGVLLQAFGGTAILVTGGGMGKWEMTKELKRGCEVACGTPGRVIDMVKSNATNLRRVTMAVVDEADRMLEMGFEPQVRSILGNVRPDSQRVMFSATFKHRLERAAESWLKNPVRMDPWL